MEPLRLIVVDDHTVSDDICWIVRDIAQGKGVRITCSYCMQMHAFVCNSVAVRDRSKLKL